MVFVVGLAGPGGVGKSTTAQAFVEMFKKHNPNINTINHAFAKPLYDVGSLLSGISTETLKDQDYKELPWTEQNAPMPCLIGWTPRKFLQIIGTECFRNNISQNFWIEASIQQINSYNIAFFEDARFINEFEFCDLVIELERDSIHYAMNHPSAMPPPPELVYKKIKLHKNIDFKPIIDDICNVYSNKLIYNK